MSEKSVRPIAIDDPTCPVCLQNDGLSERCEYGGTTWTDEETGEEMKEDHWWKSTCKNCRSVIERYAVFVVSEEVSPSPYGLVIRENRELKARLRELEMVV